MKAILHTPFADFEIEAGKPTEMFKALAQAQEVFSEKACALCSKSNLRFVVRTVAGNDFHELHCNDCGAKLAFGQSKQMPGQLFPIRKLTKEGKPHRKTGEFGKHRGWTKYRGETTSE